MNYLGMLYLSQGRYSEAEPLFTKAVEVSRRVLGPTSPALRIYLTSLAKLRLAQRRYGDAEQALREALSGREDESPIAWELNERQSLLGFSLMQQSRFAEAEPWPARGRDRGRRASAARATRLRGGVPPRASDGSPDPTRRPGPGTEWASRGAISGDVSFASSSLYQTGRSGQFHVWVRYWDGAGSIGRGDLGSGTGWYWDVTNPSPLWMVDGTMGPCGSAAEAWSDAGCLAEQEYDGGLLATGETCPRTTPVAMFEPNGFGLYDMAGNVGEMVSDLYAERHSQDSPTSDPESPEAGDIHVVRGGSWLSDPLGVRVFVREAGQLPYVTLPNVGFRCAKDVTQK